MHAWTKLRVDEQKLTKSIHTQDFQVYDYLLEEDNFLYLWKGFTIMVHLIQIFQPIIKIADSKFIIYNFL